MILTLEVHKNPVNKSIITLCVCVYLKLNDAFNFKLINRSLVCLVYLESPLLFPSYPQKSLHFVKRMMEGVIEQCLQKPAVSFVCCPASCFS